MTASHLTEDEREELALACDAGFGFGDAWVRGIRSGVEDMLLPAVEAILRTRLAAVEAAHARAAADVHAALADRPADDRRPAHYDHETRTWRDAETGEPVPTEPAWDLDAPEDES